MGLLSKVFKGSGGLVGDVLSVGSGLLGYKGSKDASRAASQSNDAEIAEYRRQFDTILGLQRPAIETGNSARSILAGILGVPQQAQAPAPAGPTVQPISGGNWLSQAIAGAAQGRVPAQQPQASAPTTLGPQSQNLTAMLEQFPGFQFALEQARKTSGAQASAMGSSPLSGNVLTALNRDVAGTIAYPVFSDYMNRLSSLAGGAQTASNAASLGASSTGANVGSALQAQGDARASGIYSKTSSLQDLFGAFGEISARRGW